MNEDKDEDDVEMDSDEDEFSSDDEDKSKLDGNDSDNEFKMSDEDEEDKSGKPYLTLIVANPYLLTASHFAYYSSNLISIFQSSVQPSSKKSVSFWQKPSFFIVLILHRFQLFQLDQFRLF